jgi:hypothetical protein
LGESVITPRQSVVVVLGMKMGFCFDELCGREYGGVKIGVKEVLGSQVEGLICRGDGFPVWIGVVFSV